MTRRKGRPKIPRMHAFRRSRALLPSAAAGHLFALLLVCPAGAEPNADDRALATALFQEGRSLMSEGKTAEACPKLQESHRLDPSGGTILNLALCHEQGGLLARSWSEFHEAQSFARRDGRIDRQGAAQSHIAALEPRLSKLTIVVPEAVRVEGLRIERNGRELAQAAWSTPMPVDGGEHIVSAAAPGKLPFSTSIVIGMESDARTIEIPVLPPLPASKDEPKPSVPLAEPQGEPVPARAATLKDSEASAESGTRRTVAWWVGGAGLVQWGVAGYFGLTAFREQTDSNANCPDGHCTQTGVDQNDAARKAADVSTVLAITGLVCIATSVYLLLTSNGTSELAKPKARSWGVSSQGPSLVLHAGF